MCYRIPIMNRTTAIVISGLVLSTYSLFSADGPDLSKIDVTKLPPASNAKGVTYAKDIRPLLEASCFRCHGEQRPKGGLKLNTLEGVLHGGDDGKVVTPGDSKKSLLVIAAAQIDEETAMPPKRGPGRGPGGQGGRTPGGPGTGIEGGGNGQGTPRSPGQGPGGSQGGGGRFGPPPKPLTPEQVGLLRAWIDQGAK